MIDSINESFELQEITEHLLNKTSVIDIISKRMTDQDYDIEQIKNILSYFEKYQWFAYQKEIKGKKFLFYWAKINGFDEFHFIDLDDLGNTGEDKGELDSAQEVFSFYFSAIFRIIKNKHHSIKIIAPEDNFKRVILYRKIIEKVIKKYEIVGYDINTYFNVVELKSRNKFSDYLNKVKAQEIKNIFKKD